MAVKRTVMPRNAAAGIGIDDVNDSLDVVSAENAPLTPPEESNLVTRKEVRFKCRGKDIHAIVHHIPCRSQAAWMARFGEIVAASGLRLPTSANDADIEKFLMSLFGSALHYTINADQVLGLFFSLFPYIELVTPTGAAVNLGQNKELIDAMIPGFEGLFRLCWESIKLNFISSELGAQWKSIIPRPQKQS